MRTRQLRPAFDRLDIRLVLSDSGATVIAGAPIGAAVISMAGGDGGSTDGSTRQDLTTILGWYLDGTPPPETYDPTAMQTPPDVTPATN